MNNPARNFSFLKSGNLFWAVAGVVLLAGIFFRFHNLGSDELAFDEGIYGFRSVGYLDYLENPAQTTPIQLFADREMPGWLYLSFHDAPPLFFLIEHGFFMLFSQSVITSRLPSALAGLGSIIVIFFVARLLFQKFEDESLRQWKNWAGLFSAAVMAVSSASVAVSRLNQLESLLFFLVILNIYFFLKLIDDKRFWWAFGASFGLCLLVKYTVVFLIPAYFSYLFIVRSPLLKNWRWYAGWGIAGLLFSPVIVYNINLYNLLGHFDLQFAYLFHQVTPEWQGISGKNQEPFGNIFANLRIVYSLPFLILAAAGVIASAAKSALGKVRWFMVLNFIFIVTLLAATGSAIRFISMLIIPGAIFIPLTISAAASRFKKPAIAAVILVLMFLSYESYFTANLTFLNRADYGIVKLDSYFDSVLGNGRPSGLPGHPNQNLNKIIKEYAKGRPVTLPALGLVYDDQISTPARLWLFSRRQYYQGIPIMPASEFFNLLKNSGGKSLKGFEIYFVKAEPATTISSVTDKDYMTSLGDFWNKLPAQTKFTIEGADASPAFGISHFSL